MNSHRPICSPGTVTLLGSGEMTEAMSKVYRAVMAKITEPVKAVFLDTPAGFQLNADEISARAVAYFRHHFDLALTVASFKSAQEAGWGEREEAAGKIGAANFIFAGPGSPTYTVNNWKDTRILQGLRTRLAEGAHLVLASAAAIAASRYTLPVYEIYKVGEDPYWSEGIDLLGACDLELAIMPHWNNAEGGTHDTRFCFMGEPRFRILEEQLPDSALILGIDEYTACIIDLSQQECRVMGAGGITLRRKGTEQTYPAGSSLPLSDLRTGAERSLVSDPQSISVRASSLDQALWAHRLQEHIHQAQEILQSPVYPEWNAVAAIGYLFDLAKAMEGAKEAGVEEGLISQAKAQLKEALGLWGARLDSPSTDRSPEAEALVEFLIQLRSKLREARQWALADEIRNRLSSLGIILEDAPEETRWRRST